MLSFLSHLLSASPKNPSVVLAIGAIGTSTDYIHAIPEDGTVECWTSGGTTPTVFRAYGAKEVSREFLGTLTLDGDEDTFALQESIAEKVRKYLADATSPGAGQEQEGQTKSIPLQLLVDRVLRPVGLEVIREREGRADTTKGARAVPVLLVYVSRRKPGPIIGEPRSFYW